MLVVAAANALFLAGFCEEDRMALRHLALLLLSLFLATVGYFVFGIVVAIYAGLWLHDEKMYYAQGLPAHVFGATGAALGVLLAWAVWRLALLALGRIKKGRVSFFADGILVFLSCLGAQLFLG
jgi:hypothetical protein